MAAPKAKAPKAKAASSRKRMAPERDERPHDEPHDAPVQDVVKRRRVKGPAVPTMDDNADLQDLMQLKDGSFVNAELWAVLESGMDKIKGYYPNLLQMDAPALAADSAAEDLVGRQSPFQTAEFLIASKKHGNYICAQNFFRHLMTWTSTPAVRALFLLHVHVRSTCDHACCCCDKNKKGIASV